MLCVLWLWLLFLGRQLRVWNYNKNEEDTRRGMRHATLKIDGRAFGDTVCCSGHPANRVFNVVLTVPTPLIPPSATLHPTAGVPQGARH